MKKRYQIDQQRAVQEFRQLAREENPNLQMIFPMTEAVGLLQEGVGHLMREAGLALMSLVMEEEVRHLAGERHEQHPARRAHRWGKEAGYCVVDGQKVPIQRTRLRSPENREQRLGSYELFQRSGPMEHAVWDKMMRGLSTRNYGTNGMVKGTCEGWTTSFREARESAAREFASASATRGQYRDKPAALHTTRPLGTALRLKKCVVLIDGNAVPRRQMIAALGITIDGRKTVFGLRPRSHRECRRGQLSHSAIWRSRGWTSAGPGSMCVDGGKALSSECPDYYAPEAFDLPPETMLDAWFADHQTPLRGWNARNRT